MTRRGFLGQLIAVPIAAAVAARAALTRAPITSLFDGPIMFDGNPLIFDPQCVSNRIYFVSRGGAFVLNPPNMLRRIDAIDDAWTGELFVQERL